MKYRDGRDVLVGDKVKLGSDEGTVIGIIGKENSTRDFEYQWGYLKKGFVTEFPKYGLIYYETAESDLELLDRADAR